MSDGFGSYIPLTNRNADTPVGPRSTGFLPNRQGGATLFKLEPLQLPVPEKKGVQSLDLEDHWHRADIPQSIDGRPIRNSSGPVVSIRRHTEYIRFLSGFDFFGGFEEESGESLSVGHIPCTGSLHGKRI